AVNAAVKRLTDKKLPIDKAFDERYWKALEEARAGNGKAEDRFLVELFSRWNPQTKTWTDAEGIQWSLGERDTWSLCPHQDKKLDKKKNYKRPHPVRLIVKGGDHFVAAKGSFDQSMPGSSVGLQADLNAAANIGLRSLLDPDF